MPSFIASGSVSIVDLTDRGSLTGYISTNQPRVQIYDTVRDTYSPDYTEAPHLVFTPLVYMDGMPLSLSDEHLTLTWKRKIGNIEYDLVQGETVAGGILTVTRNVLNSTTPYIIYVLHISYTSIDNGYTIETVVNSDISLVTSGDIGNSVVFTIYAPEGTVFINSTGLKTIQTSAYYGSTVITNAEYKWYKYVSGNWVLIPNETGDYLTVSGADINSAGSFKCVMTYQNVDYTDVITMTDKVDNYQLDIYSTDGNIFKNSVGRTFLVARLYQSGEEIDGLKGGYSDIGNVPSDPSMGDYYHKLTNGNVYMPLYRYSPSTGWTDVTSDDDYNYEKSYTWYGRDKNGDSLNDGNPIAIGKIINVESSLVDEKTTFICEVTNKNSVDIIATGTYSIVDVTDPITSDTAPSSPYEGMLWVDTSVTPSVLKIYKNGAWTIVGASDDNKNKVFTISPVPPYRVGDLWVNRQDGQIFVCNVTRTTGNYVADDWGPSSDYQTSVDVTNELSDFTTNVIDPLAVKVDSKIETWFQTTDPSSSWYDTIVDPPVDDRADHVGDLWYNNTNGNVSLKRYYKVSSDPDVYGWQDIKDQDAINALAGLDGKITTYYQDEAPTGTGLVEGDLWFDTNDSNKLYRYDGTQWVASTDNSGLQNFITNTYTQDMSKLQQNIDSKIETWFQSTDPSSTWYNPSAVPPVDNRSAHIGDMWFDNTPDHVKLQRYTYSIATGYTWQEITNQEAIDAYSRASEAKDVADSKRRVFYGSLDDDPPFYPTPPYDEGDLWSQGSSGSLLSCINSKEEGESYSASDWGEAAKYDHFIDVEYVQDKEALQSQIDGKIETWFQDMDPVEYAGIMSYTYPDTLSVGISADGTWYRAVEESGTYAFIFNGSVWTLNGNEVSLGSYGIQVITGTPTTGDTITVVYSKPEDEVPWSTATKAKHSGDLWYAPTDVVLKRYRDYGNNVFGWELIEDNDTTARLAAANAQTTADGKCQTFYVKNVLTYNSSSGITASIVESEWNNAVYESGTYVFSYDGSKWLLSDDEVDLDDYGIKITGDPVYGSTVTVNFTFNHPNPPYSEGDLWIQGEYGEILVCEVAKTAGQSYSWDDWGYGSALNEFINVTYKEDLLNLEGLIDNKIETWFQVSDPQSSWINVDIKKSHIGDVWYKDSTHIYRYSDDRTWIQYTDVNDPPESGQTIGPIRQAYITAANARDTKDGKRRVFIGAANPVPPYDRGDLWMQGTAQNSNGQILYCNTARIDGQSYVDGDFVEASKYQDYQIETGTTAPTDLDKIWLDITDASNPVMKKYDRTTSQWVVIGNTVAFYTGSTPPNPPYNASDVWIYTDPNNGSIVVKVCINTRTTGDFDPDDWTESSNDIIIRSENPPADTSKFWFNTTNGILYMYDQETGEWTDVGELSENYAMINKNLSSITILQKNVSRTIDSTQRLYVEANQESDVIPDLDKATWTSGDAEWIETGGASGSPPSPFVSTYGEYVYAYDEVLWGTLAGVYGSKELTWDKVKVYDDRPRTWEYYSRAGWRKRFEYDELVGEGKEDSTNPGSKEELEKYEYITYEGTPAIGDTITLRNYDTSTTLGFVVDDYISQYETINGQVGSLENRVTILSTGFRFDSDGLHVYDGREDTINPAEVVVGFDGIKLQHTGNATPDLKIVNTSTYVGVISPNIKVTNVMEVVNTMFLGNYKVDASVTSGDYISVYYSQGTGNED